MRRKFALLRGLIYKLVVGEDAFGLVERKPYVFNAFCPTGPGGGVDPTCSPRGTLEPDTYLTGSRRYKLKLGDEHVGDVLVIDMGDGVARTEQLGIERKFRGKGYAVEMYKQLFRDLQKEGVKKVISGGTQSPGGKGVWEALARQFPVKREEPELRGWKKVDSYSITLNCQPGQMREAGGKCGPGIGISVPRTEMPQIRGGDVQEFLRYARDKGIDLARKEVTADELSPTQAEFRQERVDAIPPSKLRDPILVSKDLYILDGTHRWVKYWQSDRKAQVPVVVLDLGLQPALELMRGFPKAKFVANSFCPTGPGGGVDPTCSPGSDTQSASFKSWFKGSKVVDGSGQPLKVYHGATQKFESFNEGAIFFTDREDVAQSFAESRHKYAGEENSEVRMIRAYLSIKKPFVIDAKGKPAGEVQFSRGDSSGYRRALADKKYDGVIIKGTSDEGTLFVAKTSSQVKSAERNSGAFDPKDTNIHNTRWQFRSSPEKLKAFQEWLRQQFKAVLLSKTDEELWAEFARQGFAKGAGRAFDDVNRKTRWKPGMGDFYEGSRQQFLKSAFGRPESVDKLKLLASRSFTDLVNVTEDMATRMSRTLTDGLARGENPRRLVGQLVEDLDVSRDRAETIARTEIIRAHAEGQLDAMEQMGVTEVGVAVEFSTAGDLRVCPRCKPLEGVVLTIDEAHGVIPVHPRCRCSFIPANVGEDQSKQKRSKKEIEAAFDEADVEAPELDDVRPAPLVEPTKNVFCPTGEGGGVDPTCSPGRFSESETTTVSLSERLQERVRYGEHEEVPGTSDIFVGAWDKRHTKGVEDTSPGDTIQASEVRRKIAVPEGYTLDNLIGYTVVRHGNEFAATVYTHPEHRRKGVATAMYSAVEKMGRTLYPSGHQTEAGKAFRKGLAQKTTKNAEFEFAGLESLAEYWTRNVFCPTGPGGGIDPTCSPGGVQAQTGLAIGNTYSRTYQGVTYTLKVLQTGFELTGPNSVEVYSSLSAAAAGIRAKGTLGSRQRATAIKGWKFFKIDKPVATLPVPKQAPAPTGPVSTIPYKDEQDWQTGKAEPGVLNGVPFGKAPPKFWEKTKDTDIKEPPAVHPIQRATVMIQEPDGRVWIVQPTNGFGGRKYTLPGGTNEAHLTNQQNALKEVWEETGLQVEITGHLGDFQDSNNGRYGRLYLGRRVGGAPWDAKIENSIRDRNGNPAAESERVTLVTREIAAQRLHRTDDLAQLATVQPIPVNTRTSGNMMKKLLEGIQPAARAYETSRRALGRNPGDATLHAAQELRGFNGTPTVMSRAGMDALVAQGTHVEMLRGLRDPPGSRTAKDLANDFKTGDHFPGFGCFGSGTYADSTRGRGNVAPNQYGRGGEVIRMALPRTARIIKQSELEAKVGSAPSGYSNGGHHSSADSWLGVQATLAGYDAIQVDGNSGRHGSYGRGFYVILNRSVVTVQKESGKGHLIQ